MKKTTAFLKVASIILQAAALEAACSRDDDSAYRFFWDAGIDTNSESDADADTDSEEGTDTDSVDGGDSDEIVWIYVPGGEFEMGCVPQDQGCAQSERPRHAVTVAAFEITRTEITQAQYLATTGENPSNNNVCKAKCPVEQVVWADAAAFCETIGGRLPSEAEWEYAVRAGGTTIYPCGDSADCMSDFAWDFSGSGGATQPSATKLANPFGIYDMMGNVWEWTADCWRETYDGAPVDGSAWDEADCAERVLRGGMWCSDDVSYLRSSYRFKTAPRTLHYYYGFRCARPAEMPE